jgi:hypothetical protein
MMVKSMRSKAGLKRTRNGMMKRLLQRAKVMLRRQSKRSKRRG